MSCRSVSVRLCGSQNFFKTDVLDSSSGSSCLSISLKFVSSVVSLALNVPCVDVSSSEEVSTLIFFID